MKFNMNVVNNTVKALFFIAIIGVQTRSVLAMDVRCARHPDPIHKDCIGCLITKKTKICSELTSLNRSTIESEHSTLVDTARENKRKFIALHMALTTIEIIINELQKRRPNHE